MDIEVEGLSKLIENLKETASDGFMEDVIYPALLKEAKAIQATAKELAHKQTGELVNSIRVEAVENGFKVGSYKKQAFFEEYGVGRLGDQTKEHAQDINGHEPHPFLYPAVCANKDIAPEIITNEISKRLKR